MKLPDRGTVLAFFSSRRQPYLHQSRLKYFKNKGRVLTLAACRELQGQDMADVFYVVPVCARAGSLLSTTVASASTSQSWTTAALPSPETIRMGHLKPQLFEHL